MTDWSSLSPEEALVSYSQELSLDHPLTLRELIDSHRRQRKQIQTDQHDVKRMNETKARLRELFDL